jgi:hypothetical protein
MIVSGEACLAHLLHVHHTQKRRQQGPAKVWLPQTMSQVRLKVQLPTMAQMSDYPLTLIEQLGRLFLGNYDWKKPRLEEYL